MEQMCIRDSDITEGTLTVDGINVMELQGKSLRAFRRKIGMIFQSFNLITRTTVIKNVLTAFVPELPWWRAFLGIFRKEEKIAALEALDQMGILDKAFVSADQLSGGQQQRVAPVSYTHLDVYKRQVEDDYRIEYMKAHIEAFKAAVEEDGVELLGYPPWGCIEAVYKRQELL